MVADIFTQQSTLQNVPILPNCILLTQSSAKFSHTLDFILLTHFYNSSINIGSVSFFSRSETHQSHHLLGCHATGINSLLIYFLNALCFSNLICLIKAVLTRKKIKRNMLDKKAVLTREKIKRNMHDRKTFFLYSYQGNCFFNSFY